MAPIELNMKNIFFYFSPQTSTEIEFGGVKNTTIQEIEISHLGTLMDIFIGHHLKKM
jgi:hypothetical protein